MSLSERAETPLRLALFGRGGKRAFSLIELLVVVAIIGMLAAFAVPAFNSMIRARGVSEAAYQIAAAVEMARQEAVGRQTPVWMALQPATNAGLPVLQVGMVCSKDGSTNAEPDNLQPLMRPLVLENVGIVSTTSPGLPASLADAGDFDAAAPGIAFSVGRTTFSGRPTITFLPPGEAMLEPAPGPGTGFTPRIAIALAGKHGDSVSQNNPAAVLVDGSTAIPTIIHP